VRSQSLLWAALPTQRSPFKRFWRATHSSDLLPAHYSSTAATLLTRRQTTRDLGRAQQAHRRSHARGL